VRRADAQLGHPARPVRLVPDVGHHHLRRAAMVYVNTLMLHDVLAEDEWSQLLASEDYRGLTPLTWAHVAMHGEFKLNMNSRLDLGHTSP
jgi:Tn3 transposase DDE domain